MLKLQIHHVDILLTLIFSSQYLFKGIDRSFELRCEIRLNRLVMTNWRPGNFFLFHFKGTTSQEQQKTNRFIHCTELM